MWRPSGIQQFSTAIGIKHRIETDVNGAIEVSYGDPELGFCNWKGMGGTDNANAGVVTILDTATLTMWYDPGLSEKDVILLDNNTDKAYEVENVEDIEQRRMYMQVRVKRTVIS
ncbi:hypothetical protein [Clostridium kluyveri]|uniref:Uncharacterized protein n=1 Tax=Clostridium kluyveri TaxID=1534 RepID=A0A1L5F996_CLOKL|nr:hypothetical protein [Clostridium kluyveri]APM39400.1 hypothetical protein BS101_11930 [Clostridium kluyveri]